VEKDWHIPLMVSIYRKAARVLVCLGVADSHSDLAIDSMPGMMKALAGRDKGAGYAIPEERGYTDDQVEAISYLLHRPWFTRVWTLLEAAVATECAIFCGDRTLDFEHLLLLDRRGLTDVEGHWKDAIWDIAAALGL